MNTPGDMETIIFLSIIMGFSIYLSWPILKLNKNRKIESYPVILSIAIGILLFIMSDIFSDVSSIIYNGNSFLANMNLSLIFVFPLIFIFIFLLYFERPIIIKKFNDRGLKYRLPLIISLGMGLQNLTEGLIFGSSWRLGLIGLSDVILIGFILQNFTEGFPIVAPLLNFNQKDSKTIALLYFIGGFPTVIGGVFGYSHYSQIYDLLFDGLATGSILFVIIPMMRIVLKEEDPSKQFLVYIGIIAGYLVGLIVNLI